MNQFYSEPKWKRNVYTFETLLKLIYIILVIFKLHAFYVGIIASVFGLMRRKSFRNEFSMNILYLLNISMFSCTYSLMYHLPVVIHFCIGIGEYINLRKGTLMDMMKNYVHAIVGSKEYFMLFRCKYEFILLPINCIMVYAGEDSYLLIILHVFYLITKYIASENMNRAVKEMLSIVKM